MATKNEERARRSKKDKEVTKEWNEQSVMGLGKMLMRIEWF